MSLNCSLCNLEFKNDDQLKQHLDGKRHKKLETIKEERENSAKRSLFVSGLKKDTFVKQLEEHFIQFGKINKIVTDHEKNAYAIIEFENEQSVQSALNSQEHKVNGKNLKISRREMKEFVSKIVNNGDKKKEILEKLKEEALIVNTLLGKCSSFDEQIDKLIEYFKLNDDELKQREEICKKLNDIFKQFWNQDEFKVNIFGSTLTNLACKGSDMDMSLLFNQYLIENQHKQVKLPKIIVKQLKQNNGQDSSDSNMAEAVETELDEDIDLDEANEINDEEEKTLKESIKTFFNDKDYNKFLKFDIEHQIKIVAKIIQRFYYDIKNLKTITNTRCPVVRFFHDKANINCDLSLNNFLAYENSKLLMVYLNLEPNLRKLIYVLRYWFKQKNLYSTSKFNSYTIIWLIIFYMQSKHIGYLPTVDYLSKITNKVNEIHGWNCSFEDDINKIKSMKPQSNESTTSLIDINSLNDLLKGFFDFYSTFQFTSQGSIHNIICTRNAQLIQNEKSELTKLSSFINIQDPFDLSHNLSANISKSTMEKFLTECKGSNDLLQYSCPPRRSANKGWGLILLTTKKSLPITHNSVNNNQLIEKSLLTLKLVDNESEKEELEEISVRKAIDFVLYLLTDCLQFEKLDGDKLIIKRKKRLRILNQICDQVDSLGLNCSPKRLKTNNNTSNDPNKPSSTYVCVIDESLNNNGNGEEFDEKEDENNKVVASYQLCAKENTWQGRRAVKRELKQKNENLNELVLEKMTSERLKSIQKSQIHAINFRIQFSYNSQSIDKADSIANKKNLSHLNIKFDLLDDVHNQNDLIDFTTLVHFLDVYINNCQEKLFTKWNSKVIQSN